MTSPRDEIDDWLGGEVRPLYPAPGALDRIRLRARRRKTRQAVFAAAGCAVVLAAAVTVPQLVSGGRQAGGHNPPVAAGSTRSPGQPSGSHSAAASTAGPAANSSSLLPQRSYLSTTTSGAPAPPHFRPTSVTFVGVGPSLVGAVIGQAGPPCTTSDCTSLAGTSDYGTSWYGVSAPVTPGPDGSAGVSQLRFANIHDGWAFGPALYETSGGGWPWHQEDTFGQRVIDVEAAGGHAYAVFGTCTGTGPDYAATCTSFSCVRVAGGQHDLGACRRARRIRPDGLLGGADTSDLRRGDGVSAHANRTGSQRAGGRRHLAVGWPGPLQAWSGARPAASSPALSWPPGHRCC